MPLKTDAHELILWSRSSSNQ